MMSFPGTTLPIALGTVLYGPRLDADEAAHQLSLFTDLGGQLIDTARVYGAWAPGGYEGYTEQLVGQWLARDGHRDQVLVCTKGAHPMWQVWQPRVTPEVIRADLEQSLLNLRTDHVDLYLLHRDDATQPILPMLQTLEALRREGKVLHYGCSNWTLPRMREAAQVARANGLVGFCANQVMWSMARANPDAIGDKTLVLLDEPTRLWQQEQGMLLMAYTSLAHGYLLRRAAGIAVSDTLTAQYDNPQNEAALALLRQAGADPLAVSLRYITLSGGPCLPVAAFSSDVQLTQAIRALTDSRWDELLPQLRAIYREN